VVSSDVDVLPYASGYRKESDLQLELRISYGWIYHLSLDQRQRFVKAVQRERIVSANLSGVPIRECAGAGCAHSA